MAIVKRSYAYLTCTVCGQERYKTLKRYQKMLETRSAQEIDQRFICGVCKKTEGVPVDQATTETAD